MCVGTSTVGVYLLLLLVVVLLGVLLVRQSHRRDLFAPSKRVRRWRNAGLDADEEEGLLADFE